MPFLGASLFFRSIKLIKNVGRGILILYVFNNKDLILKRLKTSQSEISFKMQ